MGNSLQQPIPRPEEQVERTGLVSAYGAHRMARHSDWCLHDATHILLNTHFEVQPLAEWKLRAAAQPIHQTAQTST